MNLSPDTTRVGWIGTGVMGASMAGHLLDAGYRVTLFNRTRAKAEPLLERGAEWADTPKAVAAAADVVFSIVGYPADVREVILGPDGALAGAGEGAILVDMTTSEPSLAIEISNAAQALSAVSIDAPVSGGDVGARGGTLSIMIGGDAPTVAALEPVWSILGSKWVHQGPPGAGQHTKMVNQTLVAGQMISVCEALLYAWKAGLNLDTVLESIASGAAGSWTLSNLGPRIIAGNFEPGFFVEHFLKDMRIVLDESRRLGLSLPGLALCEQLYRATAAQGHARDGTHSLMLALAAMSGVEWEVDPRGTT